jgi:hypothetical protein
VALRLVNGSVSTGGSVAFTTAFSNQNVDGTTLSTGQIPNHYHSVRANGFAGTLGIQVSDGGGDSSWYGYYDAPEGSHYPDPTGDGLSSTFAHNNNGGGGSHTHGINLNVQYVDVIICQKD